MAQIADQITAVVDYVKQQFPGHSVWDGKDHDRSAHTISVWFNGDVLMLTASFEFLSDNTASEVQKLLTQWKVADALREEAGRAKRVLVTRDGWKVTARRTPLFVALFLLAWAATASAECAWVFRLEAGDARTHETSSRPISGWGTREACEQALTLKLASDSEKDTDMDVTIDRQVGRPRLWVRRQGHPEPLAAYTYFCLPDTVDPRGASSK